MDVKATSPAPASHPAYAGMRSALAGIGVNALLAVGKAAAGIFGNSYALVADAIESGSDVLSSLIVWWGLKLSARPADANHPYGHGKAEPMAALFVAVALVLAALGIARQSVHQILTPHPMPAAWTLLVLIAVVAAKEWMFRHVSQVGEETGSGAVKGDAWHHRSDALTSGATFLGITVALIGNHFWGGPSWASADDWAALLASGVIAFNAFRIGREAMYELSDARPDDTIEVEVRRVAVTISGVESLHKCVVRKMGFDYYVELDVRVDRNMPVYVAHGIAHQVQDAVRLQAAKGRIARVLVHIEPSLLPPTLSDSQ